MPFVEGAGVALHYETVGDGDGPAAVVVHGLASDAAAYAAAAARLAAVPLRVVTYDRRGYGESGAPEPYVGTTVQEQAQDLIALVQALKLAPVLLVGEGFGALVALDVLSREPALVRGAVLVEPPLFALVPEANAALAEERLRLEEALRVGGPAAAIAEWLDARPSVPEDAIARAKAAHLGFFADYAGFASWPVSRAGLRAITTPLAVVTGAHAPSSIVLAAARLAELAPNVQDPGDGELTAAVAAFAR